MVLIITSIRPINLSYFTIVYVLLLVSFITVMFHLGYLILLTHLCFTAFLSIVLSNSAITSATAFQQLHWLPIKQRIHFKIATVTYRILQTGSPAYLSPFINLNTPSRTLRSASHNFLHVPFTSTAVGRKAFRYAAPTVWNSILQHQTFTFYWFL